MAYKKMSSLFRIYAFFLLFAGFVQACKHDGRSDTACTASCARTGSGRSLSTGNLREHKSPSLSPVLSSSAPASMPLMVDFSLERAAPVSAVGDLAPDQDLRQDIKELKRASVESQKQMALMLSLLQQQQKAVLDPIPELERPRRSMGSGSSMSYRGVDSDPDGEASRGSSRSGTPAHVRPAVSAPLALVRQDSLLAGASGRGAALSSASFASVYVGESSDGSVDTSSSDSDSVGKGVGDVALKTPPSSSRRCEPVTPEVRPHANSGIFGRLLKDDVPAYHVYHDKKVFVFIGTEYDRAKFELLVVCAYNPNLERDCYETAWDRVPEVHSRALALNACFLCMAGDLGLLALDSSFQIKSNNGDTAKVKYPHQQFLHTMRGVIDEYKLTEDEVKVLLNSVAFNELFKILFLSYKTMYRDKHVSLGKKPGHSSDRVHRYVYDQLSREGGDLFSSIQEFKGRLGSYVAAVKDAAGVSNLDFLLELFPTREAWKKPASFGLPVSGK